MSHDAVCEVGSPQEVSSVLTDERGVIEQALQCGLIVRVVKQFLNRVADFGVEHTPDSYSVPVVLPAQPIQKAVERFRFWLKAFQSFVINPSQVCVFHTFLRSTIS